VVWKLRVAQPVAAKRSNVGVGIGPPKGLLAAKPTSSVMISKMFGAPEGAETSLGKSGMESLTVRPIFP